MNKRIIVIMIVSFIAIYGLGVVAFLNNSSRRIEKAQNQMEAMYGRKFDIHENSVKKENGRNQYSFHMVSDNGVSCYGSCTWNGKILGESYVHYNYSKKQVDEIYSLLRANLEEFIVVKDCVSAEGNDALTDKIPVDKTRTYEDYKSTQKESNACFRVYLKPGTPIQNVQNALDMLAPSGQILNIYFMEIPEVLYNMQQSSDVYCYFDGPSIKKVLSQTNNLTIEVEMSRVIYHPDDYIIGAYAPQEGKCELIKK